MYNLRKVQLFAPHRGMQMLVIFGVFTLAAWIGFGFWLFG